MNFAWSFKPIFVWLFAILGLDLDESKRKSRCTRHVSIFVCLFWAFGVKIPYYSYRMYQKLTYVKLDGKSFIVITNNKITLAMNGLMYIWFHIALMVSYFGKWKSFRGKLQLLEDAIGYEGEFYRQLRREITGGIFIIFLVRQPLLLIGNTK